MGLTAKKVYAVLNKKIKKISGDVSSLGTPLFYAGSVTTADLLPASPKLGAVYNIEQKSIYGEPGTNVVWNGVLWDALGPTFDLSLLLTKENAKNLYLQKNQGSENSGKFLVVGEDGNVIPSDTQDGGVKTDTTLTKSGEAADAKVVGDKITTLKKEIVDLKQKYEMTNYMLFADEYSKKKYINGVLTNMNFWKSTNILKLDKLYDMYSPAVNGIVVFFDKNEEYISDVEFKYNLPVLKASYPANAVYVAFSYQHDYMQSYNNVMYVIRTNNYNVRTRRFYPTTKKEVGKRPSIYIYANDTQDEILWKLADAFLTRDCDVYFEPSTYVFDDVFVDLYEKYKYRNYVELPIGGGCRYYFNGSTLIANVDKMREKGYEATIDLLSCIESLNAEDYELYDGILINNGGVYVVHDECGGKPTKYVHKYYNMFLEYNTLDQSDVLRKCVGGGTGLFGECIFDNCVFKSDYKLDLSFHGIKQEKTDEAHFDLKISNCYFSKTISLDILSSNQTANLYMVGCSAESIPNNATGEKGKWGVNSWCNETRKSI